SPTCHPIPLLRAELRRGCHPATVVSQSNPMSRLEERVLRSLERKSMYSIFAPLDGDDGLSRELALEDKANPTRSGELAVWGFLRRRVRRRPVVDEQWVPAMFMFIRRFS